MSAYPQFNQTMQNNSSCQMMNRQVVYPVQYVIQHHQQPVPNGNPPIILMQKQKAPVQNSAPVQEGVHYLTVFNQSQVVTNNNRPAGKRIFINNQEYLVAKPNETGTSDYHAPGGGLVRNNNLGQVHVMPSAVQNTAMPHPEQRKVCVMRKGDIESDSGKAKPSEHHLNEIMKIPEPTQVKISTNLRNKIGHLKIKISSSFVTWNIGGTTILDLNFMRNLFYVSSLDLVFLIECSYEMGLCNSIHKLVQSKLFSDWLMLKCEEKVMPFFEVKDQIVVYTTNNFSTLLNIIAHESCLPLPLITKHEQKITYFFINFPKSSNDRVKKLNVPVFYDADNGRKKLPCKYPGIRLDCKFENAVKQFVIHIHKSAHSAISGYLSYIRQLIIYNHIVWGFLQAWTRKIRDHYNGCFKIHDIANNLSLCFDSSQETKSLTKDEEELIYSIDNTNFYLKFDLVLVKDATMTLTIDNFETNYVSDVTLVQYYRQFFLVNDMHYSDALNNIILFSQENGSRYVTDFVYRNKQVQNMGKINTKFYPPDGISRLRTQGEPNKQASNITATSAAHAEPAPDAVCTREQISPPRTKLTTNRISPNSKKSSGNISQKEEVACNPKPTLTKPLIKTRTVEEINSSVDLNINLNEPKVETNSILTEQHQANECSDAFMVNSIQDILKQCFLRNNREVTSRDVTEDPIAMQKIFSEALKEAKQMSTIRSFIDKMHTTLQKSFTNATVEKVMARTVGRALQIRFPAALNRFIITERSKESVSNNNQKTSPAKVSASRKASRCKGMGVSHTDDTADPTLKSKPTNPTKKVSVTENVPTNRSSSVKNTLQTPPKTTPRIKESPASTSKKPIPTMAVGQIRTPSPILTSANHPKFKHASPIQTMEISIISPVHQKTESSEEIIISDEVEKESRTTENVSEVDATLIETANSISINLRLPLSEKCESSLDHEATPKIISIIQANGDEGRNKEASGLEEELFKRFNIKPCYVLLDRKAVEDYRKSQEKRNKMKRASNLTSLNSNGDSFDENSTWPRGKIRKVTELEYMEARTRVLQRLRKRRQMYALGVGHQKVYTSTEIDEFVVQNQTDESKPDEEEPQKKKEEDQVDSYSTLYRECLTRKAKVVLVRVDEEERTRDEKEKWKIMTRSNSRLILTRGNVADLEKIPENKKRYFEVKDGKFYLKNEYAVKNGEIVPIGENHGHNRVRLKGEAANSGEGKTDILNSAVKEEILCE